MYMHFEDKLVHWTCLPLPPPPAPTPSLSPRQRTWRTLERSSLPLTHSFRSTTCVAKCCWLAVCVNVALQAVPFNSVQTLEQSLVEKQKNRYRNVLPSESQSGCVAVLTPLPCRPTLGSQAAAQWRGRLFLYQCQLHQGECSYHSLAVVSLFLPVMQGFDGAPKAYIATQGLHVVKRACIYHVLYVCVCIYHVLYVCVCVYHVLYVCVCVYHVLYVCVYISCAVRVCVCISCAVRVCVCISCAVRVCVCISCAVRVCVCTGPIPESVDDFWRLVWEHDVTIIVMITALVERGKV